MKPRRGGAKGKTKALNLRDGKARDAYDSAVLAAIEQTGRTAKAEAIRAVVGGTATQLRNSLERAIDAKLVKKKGRPVLCL